MKPLIIPVVGTVGVPARYGGFETLAEQLCSHFPPSEVKLVVYSEKRAYSAAERDSNFLGHERVFLPLRANGVASMFYDAWALLHAAFVLRATHVYVLGYSGAWVLPLIKLFRPRIRYIVNVDGMEWRRDKFSRPAKMLLKFLESIAAHSATTIITDNDALAALFNERYERESVTIAYGGDHTVSARNPILNVPTGHYLAIARVEPENNAHVILDACNKAGVSLTFIGNWNTTDYGRKLKEKYINSPYLNLLDPIYSQSDLDYWRSGSYGYIHGHSVGGTNPSLVEALFHTNRILSFDCLFNRSTLRNSGDYFLDVKSLVNLLRKPAGHIDEARLDALRDHYRWCVISAQYRELIDR